LETNTQENPAYVSNTQEASSLMLDLQQ